MKNPISILQFMGILLSLFILVLIGTGCLDPDPDPPIATCEPPSNVQVTGIGPNSATLRWSAPPNTTVEISVSPAINPPGPFTTTDSTFVLTGLLPNTDYKVTLTSLCPDGTTSDPVSVSFKTPGIIIVDVIVQRVKVSETVKALCGTGSSQDILNVTTPVNWDNSLDVELLKIENGTTLVFIVKEKDNTTNNFKYSAYENGTPICNATTSNVPTSVSGTGASAATLSGTGYTIQLTDVSAQMLTPSNLPVGIYSMYR